MNQASLLQQNAELDSSRAILGKFLLDQPLDRLMSDEAGFVQSEMEAPVLHGNRGGQPRGEDNQIVAIGAHCRVGTVGFSRCCQSKVRMSND